MKISVAILFLLLAFNLAGQELMVKTDTTYELEYINIPLSSVTSSYRDTVYTLVCTSSVGLVENAKRIGTWNFNRCDTSFSMNNSKFQIPLATVNYMDGLLAGKFISYYSDSTVKSEFHFQNGQLDGKFECYNEKGIMIYQGTVDPSQELANGREFNSTGSFKRDRTFLIEALSRNWINEIE